MNKNTRKVTMVVVFVLVFCLLFFVVQFIYIDKHLDTINYAQFYNEPKNSIDVLFIGSSTVRASALPAVLWEQTGITSYNLGGQAVPSATSYYVLKEALRRQSPSVVCLSAEYLFINEKFDKHDEARNQRAFDFMPLTKSKLESLSDFSSQYDEGDYLSYLFPFFFYHNRDDLTKRDLDFRFLMKRSENKRVQRTLDNAYVIQTRPEEFSDPGYFADVEVFDEYIARIIDLCNSNDIKLILLMPPICDEERWSIARHNALQEYANMHNIGLLDFNADELHMAAGIDESTDFYNRDHVNMSGGTKVSRYLAEHLSENYDVADRRGSGHEKHWDDVLNTYYEHYNVLLRRIENGEDRESHPVERADVDGDIA